MLTHASIFLMQTALLDKDAVRADNCGLMEWPKEIFSKQHSLRELILSRNHLIDIPTNILQLGALRVLRLDRNMICSVPASIGKLTALVTLDLACNQVGGWTPLSSWTWKQEQHGHHACMHVPSFLVKRVDECMGPFTCPTTTCQLSRVLCSYPV